jgi:hypothetical protein
MVAQRFGNRLAAHVSAMADSSVPVSSDQGRVPDELDALFSQLEAELGSGIPPIAETVVTLDSIVDAETETAPSDRRISRRSSPDEIGADLKLIVRGAADALPINLSETGILAETTSRLRPGTSVELLLQIDGVRRMLRATIVRSVVHSLSPKPVFRTAFRFEEPTKLPEPR